MCIGEQDRYAARLIRMRISVYSERERACGGLVHEDDRGVGDELHGYGQALALLHTQASTPRGPHQQISQLRQLHQLHHLHTTCQNRID